VIDVALVASVLADTAKPEGISPVVSEVYPAALLRCQEPAAALIQFEGHPS
jgi:hypothetical protein